MRYRLLPNAQQDLREIDDWVLGQFGLRFAERTTRSLHDTFSLLADHPGMGTVRPSARHKSVRFFHLKPYWIVYQPGEPLLIHRVYPAARDLNRLNLK
jgi:plasmid stabilization system protein ParE